MNGLFEPELVELDNDLVHLAQVEIDPLALGRLVRETVAAIDDANANDRLAIVSARIQTRIDAVRLASDADATNWQSRVDEHGTDTVPLTGKVHRDGVQLREAGCLQVCQHTVRGGYSGTQASLGMLHFLRRDAAGGVLLADQVRSEGLGDGDEDAVTDAHVKLSTVIHPTSAHYGLR